MKIELYKIYNPKEGKWASSYGWTKAGRVWHNIGALKVHLRAKLYYMMPTEYQMKDPAKIAEIVNRNKNNDWQYKNCELVKITENGITKSPVNELLKTMKCKNSNDIIYDRIVYLYGPNWIG